MFCIYLFDPNKCTAVDVLRSTKLNLKPSLKEIKIVRSDLWGVYFTNYDGRGQFRGPFTYFWQKCIIAVEYTMPGMLQQNSVVESRIRDLMDIVKSMMSKYHLLESFWGYTLKQLFVFSIKFSENLFLKLFFNYRLLENHVWIIFVSETVQ